jgi:photosystem II stability/assembly factor-like uncharacterized protein
MCNHLVCTWVLWICFGLIIVTIQPLPCYGGEDFLWEATLLPDAAGLTLRSVCFSDAQNGWIVGDKGLCLATKDGGKTWQKQTVDSDATLRCVRFNDANTGVICGDGDSKAPKASGHVVDGRPKTDGTLLVTTDGGKTWRKNALPGNFEMWCIEASAYPILQVGNGEATHLDGDIIRSSDGGKTWTHPRFFHALSDIRALDSKRWVAVGSPTGVAFLGVDEKTKQNPAFQAKLCRAFFSKDGGLSWTPAIGSDGQSCLRSLLYKANFPTLAVGDNGTILSSIDHGENWAALKNTSKANLYSITANEVASITVGDKGIYLISGNKGNEWFSSWIGQTVRLSSVASAGDVFWAVGENGTVLHVDAKKLLAAKKLPQPPEPKQSPPPQGKEPTAWQLSRASVGYFTTTSYSVKGPPGLPLNYDWQVKSSVTSMDKNEFELGNKLLKGTPLEGNFQDTSKRAFNTIEDHSKMEIGKPKEQKDAKVTVTTERLPNEVLEVGTKKVTCAVIYKKTVASFNSGME